VKDVIYRGASLTDGLRLCATIPIANSQLKCYEAVGEESIALTMSDKERLQFCKEASPNLKPRLACAYGARLLSAVPPALASSPVGDPGR
jgi:hypothetical protein